MNDRDTWQTPQELWDKLDEQYSFGFDCCASKDNKKTRLFSNDFLLMKEFMFKENPLCCWMNPPFSKAYAMFEHFFKVTDKGGSGGKSGGKSVGLLGGILKEFIQKGVTKVYTLFRDGKLYVVDVQKVLCDSVRWVNKEGTEVRSFSIHLYKNVGIMPPGKVKKCF